MSLVYILWEDPFGQHPVIDGVYSSFESAHKVAFDRIRQSYDECKVGSDFGINDYRVLGVQLAEFWFKELGQLKQRFLVSGYTLHE